jgi:copper transport protein
MSASRRLLAAAGLSCGAVVAWAVPASAHAILLRTEPAPQTTVQTAPAAVRLFFSEPVEVAFGAVRVFDVDGNRVDPGRITRASGNHEVVVPVQLRNGTYTVTWRVTSADGHPVRGGFGFFVGSPSTISAVAVPAEGDAGAAVGWGYGVVRFLWFGSFVVLVGLVAMRRWVWTPALAAAGLRRSDAASTFRRRFRPALVGTWVVLIVSGLAALVFQGATIGGLSMGEAARAEVLREVLRTEFGRWWLVQMGCAAALAVPVWALVARRPLWGVRPSVWIAVTAVLSIALAFATAFNGHARTVWHAAVLVPALAVHLLAAGVWAGGLAALVVVGGLGWRAAAAEDRGRLLRELVVRFSRVAVVAVGVLVATGVVNTIGDFDSVSDFWSVSHGRLVAAKIALLLVALAFAYGHRRRSPRQFQRTSAAELVAVTGAVAVAAALVALVPGRSLALAEKGPVNQERRVGTYTVQLFIDPTTVGDNQVHVTFVNDQGLAAAEVTSTAVSLDGQPLAMRLISPGHFVGDTSLPRPGRYRLAVTTPSAPGPPTTFDFRLFARGD